MDNIKIGFCRLCAELKHQIELTDLQTDETAREVVLNKLTRLNCHVDMNKNKLPLTVCAKCLNTLNIAFSFVVAVQSAQSELTLIEAVKLEVDSSDDESVANESPYSISNGGAASSQNKILNDGPDSNNKREDSIICTAPQTTDQNTIFFWLQPAVKLHVVSSVIESVAYVSPYSNSNAEIREVASSQNAILDDGLNSNNKQEDSIICTVPQTAEHNIISQKGNQKEDLLDPAGKLQVVSSVNETVAYESPYSNSNDDICEAASSQNEILDDGTNSNSKPEDENTSTAPPAVEQNIISQDGNQKEDLLDPAVKLEIVSSDNESEAYESSCEYSSDKDSETASSTGEIFDDGTDSNNKLQNKVTSTAPQTMEQDTIAQEDKQTKDVLDPATIVTPQLTWSDYKWTCAYCEIQYSSLLQLKNHSMESHQACNALRCADCKSRYLKFDNFIKHIGEHRKYLKLRCFKCQEEFNTLLGLKRHTFSHYAYKYKCDGCNSCFASSYKLHKHMKIYYKNSCSKYLRGEPQPADLVCPICKKKLCSKKSYNSHKKSHTDRKRDYTCDVCGKSYMTKSALVVHKMCHNKTKSFICDICKSAFKAKQQLIPHIRLHYSTKAFSCDNCGKSFNTRSQLKTHSVIHTDYFPYACTYCNKGFNFKSLLTVHLRQHTGEKPYSCDTCNKDFTHGSNYLKHMKRIHNQTAAIKRIFKIIT